MRKRMVSLLMALVMVLSLMPVAAIAEELTSETEPTVAEEILTDPSERAEEVPKEEPSVEELFVENSTEEVTEEPAEEPMTEEPAGEIAEEPAEEPEEDLEEELTVSFSEQTPPVMAVAPAAQVPQITYDSNGGSQVHSTVHTIVNSFDAKIHYSTWSMKKGTTWHDLYGSLSYDKKTAGLYSYQGYWSDCGYTVTAEIITREFEGDQDFDGFLITEKKTIGKKTFDSPVILADVSLEATALTDVTYTATVASAPSRPGYSFDGWYSGEIKLYSGGEEITLQPGDVIELKAHWTPKQYDVTFFANTGRFSDNPEDISRTTRCTYYEAYVLPPEPTREGSTFAGWYSTALGGSPIQATMTDEDCTFYAHWKLNTIITFDTDVTGMLADPTFKIRPAGDTYGTLPSPSRAGYTFAGWYTGKNGSGTEITKDSIVPESNITLYAKWTALTCSVTFNVNKSAMKGSVGDRITPATYSDVTITYGSTADLPGTVTAPTCEGYTFKGWYYDGSKYFDTDGKAVRPWNVKTNEDIVLDAGWSMDQITVTLDANGGLMRPDGEMILEGDWSKKDLTYNYYDDSGKVSQYGTLPEPVLVGYNFRGWYRDGVQAAPATTIKTSDHILLASWTAITYNIVFDKNADSATGNMETQTVSYHQTVALNANGFSRTGYTFKGWSLSKSVPVVVYSNQGSIKNLAVEQGATVTLYAVWEADSYSVTLDANGGAFLNEATTTNITIVFDGTYAVLDLYTPYCEGYSFQGWYTAAEGGKEYKASKEVTEKAPQTLFAHWKANRYTLLLAPMGGTVDEESTGFRAVEGSTGVAFIDNYLKDYTLYQSGYTYGSEATELPDATATTLYGYTFDGWYTAPVNGKEVKKIGPRNTGDMILFAHWTAATSQVTLDANGGQFTKGGSPTFTVSYGLTYAKLTDYAVERTGYLFNGWYTEDGQKVTALTPVTAVGEDHTIHAEWTPRTYPVVLVLDNGSVDSAAFTSIATVSNVSDLSSEQQQTAGSFRNFYLGTYTYDTVMTLPNASETSLIGHRFTGWYTAPTGGEAVEEITKGELGGKVFYARGERCEYTVTLNVGAPGSATDIAAESISVTYERPYFEATCNGFEGTFAELPQPTADGYLFTGWYSQPSGGDQITALSLDMQAQDHSIYAHWVYRNRINYKLNGGQLAVGTATNWFALDAEQPYQCGEDAVSEFRCYAGSMLDFINLLNNDVYTARYNGMQESFAVYTIDSFGLLQAPVTLVTYNRNLRAGSRVIMGSRLTETWEALVLEPTMMDFRCEVTDIIPTQTGKVFIGWTDAAGNPVEPGTVYASNTDVTLEAQWLDVTDDLTATYDGAGHPLTVNMASLTDLPEATATVTYLGTATDGTVVSGTDAPVRAGVYTAAWEVSVHDKVYGTGINSVTITPKEVGLRWGKDSFGYDGAEKSVTATATGLCSGDTGAVTLTNSTATHAGTYVAEVTALDNPNYQLPTDTSHSWSISKGNQILTTSRVYTLSYTDDHKPVITLKTDDVRTDESTVTYEISEDQLATRSNLTLECEKTYYVRRAATKNYNASNWVAFTLPQQTRYTVKTQVTGSGSILVKEGETAITSGDEVYTGTALTLIATAGNGYEFAAWCAGGSKFAETAEAGYTVTDDITIQAIFTKTGTKIAMIPTLESAVYDGTEKVSFAPGADAGYTVTKGALKGTDAGVRSVTFKLDQGYVWSDGTGADKMLVWNISKAPQAAPVLGVFEVAEDTIVDVPENIRFFAPDGTTGKTTASFRLTQQGYYGFYFAGDANHYDSAQTLIKVKAAVKVVTGQPTGITKSGAVLHGSISEGVSEETGFRFWNEADDTKKSTVTDTAGAATLTGLATDTSYVYQFFAVKNGKTYNGSTITFRTAAENEPTGAVNVAVSVPGDVDEGTVSIEHGNTVLASQPFTVSGGEAVASFDKLPDGYYNVVLRTKDYTETRMITISQGSSENISFFVPTGSISTTVAIEGGDTPAVAVSGLPDIIKTQMTDTEAVARGEQDVEICLNVERCEASAAEGSSDITFLMEVDEVTSFYIDLSLYQTVRNYDVQDGTRTLTGVEKKDIGCDNESVLEIAIPFSAAGTPVMYRYHDGVATKLLLLNHRPVDPVDGTYYVGEGYLFLYAKNFSTYLIGYQATAQNPDADDDDSDSTPAAVKSAPTGDTGIALYAGLALMSLLAIGAGLSFRKRREF